MLEKVSWQSDRGCRVLIDHLQDGIVVIEDGKLAYVNQRMATMLAYPVNMLIGRSFIEFVSSDDKSLILERYRARIAGEKVPEQYDIHLVTAHGALIFCALNIGLIESQNGDIVTISSVRDVTQQKAELAALEASKIELKSIFDQLPDAFYRTNMQGIITMISPSCFDILGYRQEVMLGTLMANYYETPEERQKVVQAIANGGGKPITVEAGLRHKNGSIIWISTNSIVRFGPDGKAVCIEGIARDISERKRMEDQLTTLSRTDELTGVHNRSYFMHKSEEVIQIMTRYARPASMMMMDLDHFKKINDNFGHHIGDLALIAFARACRDEIRDSDVLGRQEFGLLLPETTIQSAQLLAERIRKVTAAIEIPLDNQTIKITVSIGLVALGPEDQSLDSVMRRSDRAMYQAKEKGRNQVVTLLEAI
jgi:diguanylate cyclase (GGDEF)-like protein/PAS domain S-box-containing protein